MWIKQPNNTINKSGTSAVLNTSNVFEVGLLDNNIVFVTITDSLIEHWEFKTEQEAQSEYEEILRRLEVKV